MGIKLVRSDELYKVYATCLKPSDRSKLTKGLGYSYNSAYVNSVKRCEPRILSIEDSHFVYEFFESYGGYDLLLEASREIAPEVVVKKAYRRKNATKESPVDTTVSNQARVESNTNSIDINTLKANLANVARDAILLDDVDTMKTIISVLNSTVSLMEFRLDTK